MEVAIFKEAQKLDQSIQDTLVNYKLLNETTVDRYTTSVILKNQLKFDDKFTEADFDKLYVKAMSQLVFELKSKCEKVSYEYQREFDQL